jgi:hypothetical protein
MILLKTASILAGAATLEIAGGQYAALMLRIAGANQAAQTLTVAQLGLVNMKIAGRNYATVRFDDLQTMNQIDLGQVESASAVGAAFTFSAIILASRAPDGNVFHVEPGKGSHVYIDLSGVTGVIVASGNVELYGIPMEGVQSYIPTIQTFAPSVTSGGNYLLDIPVENLTQIYATTLTNLDRVQVTRDGQIPVQASSAAILAFSNMDGRLEAAYTTGWKIDFHRSGALTEALSDSCQMFLSATGGAANPRFIACGLDFTPDEFKASSASVQAFGAAKLSRKNAAGKGRPGFVVEHAQKLANQ